MAWLLGSLAPVTACVLLTVAVINSENSFSANSHRHAPLIAMILSNQNYAAYAPDNFRQGENNLFSVTFDWTNHSSFTSSIASFPQDRVNR